MSTTEKDLAGTVRTGTPGALEAVPAQTAPEPSPEPVPEPTPTGQMIPIFTTVFNPNYVVMLDGVAQTPTHYDSFEAAEHASALKLRNPLKKVLITTSGVKECTLKKL